MRTVWLIAAGFGAILAAHPAVAKEYYVGGPVHAHDMEIVANYLVGIQMVPMPPGRPHEGADVIHLEADVHATADNVYGYPDGGWVPYVGIAYQLKKDGSDWAAEGTLLPMTAKDGPHYADNVKMDGPGTYRLTYTFTPPSDYGFYRHTDEETGVPAWWQPFSQSFEFNYPQK